MKLFFSKKIIFFLLPIFIFFAVIIATFYLFDPFEILTPRTEFKNSIVSFNEDYVATEQYLRTKNEYNSFIFGSSRAGCGFQIHSWGNYLKENDHPFCFAASTESIFGIVGKVRLIDKEKGSLDNVLLIMDTDVTFKRLTNSVGHLYIKHPLVSGENKQAFIIEYIRDYIFTGFFVAYLDYKLFKTKRKYMNGFFNFNADTRLKYVPFNLKTKEELIKKDKDLYYAERKDVFYDRDTVEKVLKQQIGFKAVEYLKEIRVLFNKHHTNYKIVISPLYDQKKINPKDAALLREIFGSEQVFDFSGKNELTNAKENYYESSHYRVSVGDEILKNIYSNQLIRSRHQEK